MNVYLSRMLRNLGNKMGLESYIAKRKVSTERISI